MKFFTEIDRLLRGDATRASSLRAGRIEIAVRTLLIACASLGALYGVFMGLFAAMGPNVNIGQLLASSLKVPLLFLLTLVVTFPSLYVFSALADTKLRPLETLRLLLASVAVTLSLLASFGPVTGFFTLSTDSYAFMKLLNVALFGISGIAGLWFLRKALDSLFDSDRFLPSPAAEPDLPSTPKKEGAEGASDDEDEQEDDDAVLAQPLPPPFMPSQVASRLPPVRRTSAEAARARLIFRVWTVIFGVVGAQMAWIMRPFVGSPDLPFELFRKGRVSNFFEAVLQTLGTLLN